MTDARPPLLTLDEVARRTGRSIELLREWCATGRIRGEHLGGRWLVAENRLEAIRAMPRPSRPFEVEGPDARGRDPVVAIAFPDRPSAVRAARALVRRLGLAHGSLSIGPLALDGLNLFVVAGRLPTDRGRDIEAIVRDNRGTVVDAVTRPLGFVD